MKKLFILMACVSLSVRGYAQAPDVLPQVFSPNAAELGKYGKVPVNYFNGLPNITIPLTELKAKGYTLPVYLTYHAGGNKPDQHPGWVGQGWALHAGGCINRIIRGKRDETTRFESGVSYDDPPGYLYHSDAFQAVNWKDSTIRKRHIETIHHGYDYEPDEFQVNVDGINASFYFAGNGKVKIVSRSDIDFTVQYSMNEGAEVTGNHSDRVLDYKFKNQYVRVFDTFSEFIITTKDGTKYYFGGVEDAIEYSIIPAIHEPEYAGNEYDWDLKATANTWMLTKIVRTDGEVITFKYQKRNTQSGGTPVVMVDSHRVIYSEFNGTPYPFIDTFDNKDGVYGNFSFYFLLISYLESIECKSSSDRLFFYTSESTQLGYDYDSSIFYNRHGNTRLYEELVSRDYYEQLDSINTSHGKIHFEYTDNPEIRLRLETVKIVADQTDTLKYEMTYYGTPLPRYNSRKTDIWGYYNNKDSYDPVERDTVGIYTANLNRQKAEMLFKIKYPTGGWTEFEYESHDYSQIVSQFPFSIKPGIGQAGGLRVKKITDCSPGNQPNERLFFYTKESGRSSGILSGRPQFYATGGFDTNSDSDKPYTLLGRLLWNLAQSIIGLFVPDYQDDILYYIFFSEQSLNQLSDTDGNHVTYSQVSEVSTQLGRTEYYYSNHDTSDMYCMDKEPFYVEQNNIDDLLFI